MLIDILQDFFKTQNNYYTLGVGLCLGYVIGAGVESYKRYLSLKKSEKERLERESVPEEPDIFKLYDSDQSTLLVRYLKEFGLFKVDPALEKIKNRTSTLSDSGMMAGPICAQLMALIGHVANSKKHIEVGVYTGYNLLQQCLEMKSRLGDEYLAIALDVTQGPFFLTRHHFAEAKINKKNVDFRCQPAFDSMKEMCSEKELPFGGFEDLRGTIDTIFIDADKESYPMYYDYAIELLRKGGVLFVDNALMYGAVTQWYYNGEDKVKLKHRPEKSKAFAKYAKYIHETNEKIKNDPRVKNCLLPIGDGLNVVVKL